MTNSLREGLVRYYKVDSHVGLWHTHGILVLFFAENSQELKTDRRQPWMNHWQELRQAKKKTTSTMAITSNFPRKLSD